jgi:dipeptidyl aminopeptidase/acylaminoacyl peptidase
MSLQKLLLSFVIVLAPAFIQFTGAQTKRPMTLVDMLEIPQVSNPQLSPGGAELLFVVSRADWKANRRISHIWHIGVDGADAIQMTNGENGESSPIWSPDGARFAFTARRPGGEESRQVTQIYLQAISGGEAQQLSRHPTAVSSIAWAPDGNSIFFLASDPKSADEKEREKLRDDVFAFDENYKHTHLWKITLADEKEHKVTDGDFSITGYSLSRNGKKIVIARAPNPLLTDRQLSDLYLIGESGGEAVRLTENRVSERGMELSPDHSRVLFTAAVNQNLEPYYNNNVFVVPASGGEARLVAPDFPHEVSSATWSKDGSSIIMLCNMGVHSEFVQLNLETGEFRQWTDGEHGLRSFSYSPVHDKHVFTMSTPSSPGEIYILSYGQSTPTQVTRITEYVSLQFDLPRDKAVQWKGADGVTVEGILTYPLGYREGERYPLAVYTHGGPRNSDKLTFSPWREYRPVLAAKGYAVLRPNYRGSTGYGNDFLRDMVGHYFNQAHRDVMAGVDYLIEQGIADPDRLVKFGWSAGGHMTNKIITFTNRFKAASSGAGAVNWISMYAQSDVRDNRTPWFGGTPWKKDAPISVYWNNSSLKDVWKVTTPTIILVGQNDARVPMPQSVELYRALKSNGVPTHLYVAPREPHGWRELRHELFKMNVELEWFEKHAMKRSYTWEKAPGK